MISTEIVFIFYFFTKQQFFQQQNYPSLLITRLKILILIIPSGIEKKYWFVLFAVPATESHFIQNTLWSGFADFWFFFFIEM